MVTNRQRFTRRNPCPICGGGADLPQGRGIRCYGFRSGDGQYAHCSREEHAGTLDQDNAGTYAHKLTGDCRCGARHDPAPRSLPPVTPATTPTKAASKRKPVVTVEKTHDYTLRSLDGSPVAVHRRTDGRDEDGNPAKKLSWLRNGDSGLQGLKLKDLPLYGAETIRGRPDDLVILVEGEKACDALRALPGQPWLPLGTVTGAGATPSSSALAPLADRLVYLWPDADDAGQRHMARIAEQLVTLGCAVKIVRWLDPPKKGADAADFIAQGGAVEDIDALLVAAEPYGASELQPNRRVVTRLADVETEQVRWAWAGRIPLGKLSILDGDPGLGKSTALLDLAARLTAGRLMPDDTENDLDGPAAVVILSAEDGLADTIRPRLDAAGANTELVYTVTIAEEYGGRELTIPADLSDLEATVNETGAKLVIIDPLVAYFGSGVDSHKDQDVRRALTPAAKLAERTGAAIIGIRHLSKTPGTNATYRGGGSIGIIGAARSGLLVAIDPDDEDRRVLARVKGNLAPPVPALAFRLEDTGTGVARIAWDGITNYTAAQLLAQPTDDEERSAVDEAADVLMTILEAGPMAANEVDEQRRASRIRASPWRRAKARLGIKSRLQGFGKDGTWYWYLPEHADGPAQHENTNISSISGMRATSLDLDAENGTTQINISGETTRVKPTEMSSAEAPKSASNHRDVTVPPEMREMSLSDERRPPTSLVEMRCVNWDCRRLLTAPDERRHQMCHTCFRAFQSAHHGTGGE